MDSSSRLIYHLKSCKLLRAIELNRRIGMSAISKAQKYIASTNLIDGIDIFTLPDLTYYGFIQQAVDLQNNLTLGLAFIDDEFIVCGGKGAIFMYRLSNLELLTPHRHIPGSLVYLFESKNCRRVNRWQNNSLGMGEVKTIVTKEAMISLRALASY
ncbi:hypothetical protein GALMADRAFT_216748 [Galerina marginata CBS 339.88]|uniref:CNH domain-containing protein n=1 Tax=Galerina marginata (strain CBS 339.88) TaxID=685588 RepID=A0A067SGJ9_GALM3|nr:hypothetical protein GALMADRAFT_216748 [Galerina marginata CBS 339.88]